MQIIINWDTFDYHLKQKVNLNKMNLNKTIFFSAIMMMVLALSCSTESVEVASEKSIQTQELDDVARIDALLEKVTPALHLKSQALANAKSSEEERSSFGLSFLVVKNITTGELALANFREVGIFPIFELPGTESRARSGSADYMVTCTKGGSSSSSTCSGVSSCAKRIKECLDSGGCAEICQDPGDNIIIVPDDFFDLRNVPADLRESISRITIDPEHEYAAVEFSYVPGADPL